MLASNRVCLKQTLTTQMPGFHPGDRGFEPRREKPLLISFRIGSVLSKRLPRRVGRENASPKEAAICCA